MLDVRTIISPRIGWATDKPPSGAYRWLVSQRIHLTCYGQRWQDETLFSMIKRRLGRQCPFLLVAAPWADAQSNHP
ncbi:MAG TPA: hypothetical protein VNA25_23290 [Phycisphaerae bacterium]|nr:hypothetical protein [Phycisphaerae bacterium]